MSQKFIIKKKKRLLNPQFGRRLTAMGSDDDESKKNNSGCIWMFVGFIGGPIGLIIAAIFGKLQGAFAALVGLLIWAVVYWSGLCKFIVDAVYNFLHR